jgi:hypothetical protein
MVSTGRLHGFESLEERSLLLALDFTGIVEEVLSQPFRLKFEAAGGDPGEHIPDFLAVSRDGVPGVQLRSLHTGGATGCCTVKREFRRTRR